MSYIILGEGKECHIIKAVAIVCHGFKKLEFKGLIEMSPGKGRVRMHIDKLPIIPASFKIGMTSLYKDCSLQKIYLKQRKISGKARGLFIRCFKDPGSKHLPRKIRFLACRMRNSLISVPRVNWALKDWLIKSHKKLSKTKNVIHIEWKI